MSSTEPLYYATEFIDKLATTNNVAIVTDATTTIDDNGAVFIVLFGQVLDFTKKMDKIIINTNQCRSFGVQCV